MAGVIEYDITPVTFSVRETGNSWPRGFLITGLTAGPSIPDLIDEAYDLIPNAGTPAPSPIFNMYVREANIESISQNTTDGTWEARGTIIYRTPSFVGGDIGIPDDNGPGIVISSVSNVEEFDTDRDATGTQITTTYDGVEQAHKARSVRVGRTLTFQRLENANPRARQDIYEGKLNSATWNGYAAKTVLLQSIDYETDDQGVSYRVAYTFVIRDDWQFRAVHEDPFFPGNPLPGASGAEVTTVDMFDQVSFAGLNIILP